MGVGGTGGSRMLPQCLMARSKLSI